MQCSLCFIDTEVSRDAAIQWCLKNGFELVELSPAVVDSDDSDEGLWWSSLSVNNDSVCVLLGRLKTVMFLTISFVHPFTMYSQIIVFISSTASLDFLSLISCSICLITLPCFEYFVLQRCAGHMLLAVCMSGFCCDCCR